MQDNFTFFVIFENYNVLLAKKAEDINTISFNYLPRNEPILCIAVSMGDDEISYGEERILVSEEKDVSFSIIEKISYNRFDNKMRDLFSTDIWTKDIQSPAPP